MGDSYDYLLFIQKLIEAERYEDLKKSAVDSEYQHKLMLEYGIIAVESSDENVDYSKK